MNRRMKAVVIASCGVLALAAAVAVAAPTIYRAFLVEEAAEAPSLSADASALDAAGGSELDLTTISGEWLVSDGSYAGYRVNEVLNGSPVTVTGRTDQVTGSLTLDGLTLQAASFEVDVASIATDSSQRDRYFREQALRADANPSASFLLAAPVTIGTAPETGAVIEQEVSGDLNIAGATQRVSFTVQLQSDGETTHIAGQIPIVFADYGVEAPSLGFVSVEDNGFVEFEFVAIRA